MNDDVLEFLNVSKIHGSERTEIYALRDISIKFGKGEMVAIVGPSGSGKSTLLHLAGALDLPTRGAVSILGQSTTNMNDARRAELRLKHIGFVYQFFSLFSGMSVIDNISVPLLLAGSTRAAAVSKGKQLLSDLDISSLLNRLPDELSGGEIQRVTIARALSVDPEVILADEPTGQLDSENSIRIATILRDVARSQGRTVVVATHDLRIAQYATRTLNLADGRRVAESTNLDLS